MGTLLTESMVALMVRFGAADAFLLGLFSLSLSLSSEVSLSVPPSIFFVFLPHVKRGRSQRRREGRRENAGRSQGRRDEAPMPPDGLSACGENLLFEYLGM